MPLESSSGFRPYNLLMKQKVTIVIPTRNEEKFIADTLISVLKQNYPSDLMEILVADGVSDDKTAYIVQDYEKKNRGVRLINNPERVVPNALNYAIKEAKGDLIIRMDSHSIYPENYVSTLVNASNSLQAENVGARVVTLPANEGVLASSIAAAISHPMGVGNSSFRLKGNTAQKVDTVPFGCFRREVFDRIGLFDTDLIRNQDDEFNGRIIKNGGKIYLVPDLEIKYYARGTINKMMKMFFQYGLFKPLVNKKLGSAATLRQFVPPLFVLFLLSCLLMPVLGVYFQVLWVLGFFLYLSLDLAVSVSIAQKKSRIGMIFVLPFLFPLIHLAYGYGYLKGYVLVNILGQNPGGKNFGTSR